LWEGYENAYVCSLLLACPAVLSAVLAVLGLGRLKRARQGSEGGRTRNDGRHNDTPARWLDYENAARTPFDEACAQMVLPVPSGIQGGSGNTTKRNLLRMFLVEEDPLPSRNRDEG